MVGSLFLVVVFISVYLMWSHTIELHESGGYAHATDSIESTERVNHLLNLVRAQNHTIVRMGQLLGDEHMHPVAEQHTGHHEDEHHDLALKDAEIFKLKAEAADRGQHGASLVQENQRLKADNARLSAAAAAAAAAAAHATTPTTAHAAERLSGASSSHALVVASPPHKIDDMCERRYGLSLIDTWRSKAEVWCGEDHEPSSGVPGGPLPTSQSKLVCYPHLQEHRRVARRGGPDTICVAENFVVDFSKVSGGIGDQKLTNYVRVKAGALQSSCKKTDKFKTNLLHKHLQTVLGGASYTDAVPEVDSRVDRVEETATYMLIRDEDCENSFHSTADFMNMFLSANVVGVDPAVQQVVLWDRHRDGPYIDLISKAFAGGRKVLRTDSFGGQKVMFKKLVFHLESPAGLIFPKVSLPTQLRCKGTGFFKAYAKHVLHAFDLWAVDPPAVPHATLLLRHRTDSKNVGRILANEKEVVATLASANMLTYTVADTARMPYAEQLALIRRTNILIGVHGAGLMLILFAANEAVLLEMHPSYRQDRHFRHASRMVGKDYMPLRASERETCQGSSDNVKVPIEEFRRTLDGAVRLARGYDDGISECGAVCPAGILALDQTLDKSYGADTRSMKGPPVSTRFPCA